ncbi:translocation protein SEC63, putative [Plasmodium knowlesi strain H]|uniref:Translocation protein SEC63, putative n=3 Tax=Plasmodium knowlesi TaxID=5850 RepID=A0A5K1V7A4_PLAKH|nr:DNAJ-like Sec63-like protein [Plasmodium knowlesi strain H]OTN63795.1 putative DNAJ-like Sec63-like protein [Plasmodium knowlesi]CAA9990796.1 translocation protein SEC63, putative [Plasmodium knowlesi strain H]SBO21057.1 translocation protein SEC63, putative [Plasmodium knowlesi strain H]SBO21541.1 translocation protein SEC63, putative [Plasmodium knowlesi strain H]VVS80270.1 translocation protein SEC63, putative [Plasmodium knowlesi strain H]|eukprot:XP_002262084.1 DNAJ-like Sec63-like protein [Plasmodium knowlesi strain H]
MSQFRDTFTKDSKKEPLLSYDDSAFIFFAGTVLICVLIPCTYIYIKSLFNKIFNNVSNKLKKSKHNSVYRSCACALCKEKLEKRNKSTTLWEKLGYRKIIQFFLLVIFWGLLFILVQQMLSTKPMQTFDPFEILEVHAGATVGEIKKAYRLKSLKYHPDKNPNDTSAAAKFILITKAYQALTDEISKENYEKYGNPDGPGMMKVGIGLPKLLIDEKYQLLILSIFFLIFLVFIPATFIIYYQRQKQYGPNGVKVETLQYLTYTINENSRAKSYPEMLAATAESRDIEFRQGDDEYVKKMIDELVEPKKRTFRIPVITKNYFIILAHMQRRYDLLSEEMKEDLKQILQFSLLITHSMIEISILRDWFLTAQAALTFRRCLIQALDIRSSSLLQIPHFTEGIIKHVHKGKLAVKEILDFVHQNHESRKGLNEMTDEEILDVKSFCNIVPDIKMTARILVEDESHIVKGDVASIYIHIDRTNLHENEAAGYIHAPFFPLPKFEEWWIVATYKGDDRILKYVHVKNCEKIIEEKLQFMVDRVGNLCVSIYIMSDCYFGCDKKLDLPFRAYSQTEIKREIFVHPEDIELDNEPTLFQQMIGDVGRRDDSSDEEETGAGGDPNRRNNFAHGNTATAAPRNSQNNQTNNAGNGNSSGNNNRNNNGGGVGGGGNPPSSQKSVSRDHENYVPDDDTNEDSGDE